MMKDQECVITRLYGKLKGELCAYAERWCPGEGEDVVHEAFARCHGKLSGSRGEAEQRGYLYAAVRNVCRNWRRDRREEPVEVLPEVYADMAAVDTYDYVHELIDRLPERERDVLRLMLEGYDTREIAERMGAEFNTVRHWKREAYERMRRALREEI